MTFSPVRGRVVAALLLLFLSAAAWLSPLAAADPPAPETKVEKGAAASAPTPMTDEDIEAMLLKHPAPLTAMVLLKYLPALAGLILLVLEFSRLHDIRQGLLPRPAYESEPRRVVPGELYLALVALVALLVGPSVLIRVALDVGVLTKEDVSSLAIRFGVTAAASVPIAVYVTIRRRKALRAVQRGDASALDFVFGRPSSESPAPVRVKLPMRRALRDALRTFCVATAAAIAVGLAAKFGLKALGVPFGNQELVMRMLWPKEPHEPALIAAYGVAVAPWVEECIFRGFLQPAVGKRFGRSAGVWGSSLIFAGFHVQHFPEDLYSFFPLLVLAFFLARLKDRTESILATTTVHVLNNATTLIPLALMRG